ncbi:MAG: biotin--[acetyl-CoA-carboxylase] ligase [Anaerolineae bacterium]|nr:biotin--[acetyl-CoA-carboxylase] ligase [Anaerolineae bacterium]
MTDLTTTTLAARMGERPYRWFDSLPSTMDEARAWLHEGAPHGALVLADQQTAGRGRLSRPWHTPPGSALAVSMVLHVAPQTVSHVTMAGALAVAEALDALGVPDVGLKWPNDVLIGRRKVAGIGLNVSVEFTGSELEGQAVSLSEVLPTPPDRWGVLCDIVGRLEHDLPLLGSRGVWQRWRDRLVTLGRQVTVEAAHPYEGTAEDVDDDGSLWVRDREGLRRRVLAGDVRVRDQRPE